MRILRGIAEMQLHTILRLSGKPCDFPPLTTTGTAFRRPLTVYILMLYHYILSAQLEQNTHTRTSHRQMLSSKPMIYETITAMKTRTQFSQVIL
jgi:hypothetical protein